MTFPFNGFPLRIAPSGPLVEGVNQDDTILWDTTLKKWKVGSVPSPTGVCVSSAMEVTNEGAQLTATLDLTALLATMPENSLVACHVTAGLHLNADGDNVYTSGLVPITLIKTGQTMAVVNGNGLVGDDIATGSALSLGDTANGAGDATTAQWLVSEEGAPNLSVTYRAAAGLLCLGGTLTLCPVTEPLAITPLETPPD